MPVIVFGLAFQIRFSEIESPTPTAISMENGGIWVLRHGARREPPVMQYYVDAYGGTPLYTHAY